MPQPGEHKATLHTVGFEGEVHAFLFVLIDHDPKTNRHIISLARNDEVLSVFTKTRTGIECVQDKTHIDDEFMTDIRKLAKQRKFLLSKLEGTCDIFEFVTQPAHHTEELSRQFKEIEQIEIDLIQYLLKQKRKNPNIGFVCVKNWLDDYKKRNPKIPLPESRDSHRMYIVLDATLSALMKAIPEENQESLLGSPDLSHIASGMQKELVHSPQFNFVVALGKDMGSMLCEIHESSNNASQWNRALSDLQNEMEMVEEIKQNSPANDPEFSSHFKKVQNEVAHLKRLIKMSEIKINILKKAAFQAECACKCIREQSHRKLTKLEGFFFLLSMRILTETENIILPPGSTGKNKYHFFMKTKLSDLIHSLSDADRSLLKAIGNTWDEAKKNELLTLIAGSSDVLRVRFPENFTIKEVIESALGWRQDSPPLCDQLPNAPTKQFETPQVPKGMHRKEERAPKRRVLLEYRSPKEGTLMSEKASLKKILEHDAGTLNLTTRLQHEEFKQFTRKQAAQQLQRTDYSINKKLKFVQALRLYHPGLFKAVSNDNPKEMSSLEQHERALEAQKLALNKESKLVEGNVSEALQRLSKPGYTLTKDELRTLFYHEDDDLILRQLNYLFILSQNSSNLAHIDIAQLHRILFELYADAIIATFKLPIKKIDIQRLAHISRRYEITLHIPILLEYFNFLEQFKKVEGAQITASVNADNPDQLMLEYKLGDTLIEEINKEQNQGTYLLQACQKGLVHFIDALLRHGSKATSTDLIEAFYSSILTEDLAENLITAGADPLECFRMLAEADRPDDLVQIAAILGKERLDQAIKQYSALEDHEVIVDRLVEVNTQLVAEQELEAGVPEDLPPKPAP